MTKLLYNYTPMKVDPINRPMEEVRKLILARKPQVVILEPGDKTRYLLLLVPLTESVVGQHLHDFGIAPERAYEYLFVSRLNAKRSTGVWVPTNYPVRPDQIRCLVQNLWTEKLIAWWLTELFETGDET